MTKKLPHRTKAAVSWPLVLIAARHLPQIFSCSVWVGRPTPGASLMNLRYRDERGATSGSVKEQQQQQPQQSQPAVRAREPLVRALHASLLPLGSAIIACGCWGANPGSHAYVKPAFLSIAISLQLRARRRTGGQGWRGPA